MRTQVLVPVLLLVAAVALPEPSSASLRPRTPDEFHELLLWAQRVAEGKGGNLVGAPEPRPRPRQRPRPPATSTAAAPAWRDDVDHRQHLLPANEEYDRSERFSHSILHGYRPAI